MTPSRRRTRWLGLLASLLLTAGGPSPDPAATALLRSRYGERVRISCWLEPCRLSGDFDGDGAPDRALLVMEPASGRRGIAFLHADGTAIVVGAGNEIGLGGDDYRWLDEWHVMSEAERATLREIDPALPRVSGDALHVAKAHAASAMIHWIAPAYAWYPLGD